MEGGAGVVHGRDGGAVPLGGCSAAMERGVAGTSAADS